jgi:peroxiredoxin
MALSRQSRDTIFDLSAGFGAFLLVFAVLVFTRNNDSALLFLLAETVYFAAGLLRGEARPHDPLLKTLFIVIPGVFVILLLAYTGVAFTAHVYIFCFVAAALMGGLFGILWRQFWRKGWYLPVATLTACLLALTWFSARVVLPRAMAASMGQEADARAPSFSLITLDGASISSEQLRGRVVVLAFWATWCRPCLSELPQVQKVYERYRGDGRVAVLAVDSGISDDTVEKQRSMISWQHWDLPFAQDSENLEHQMDLHGLPMLVVLDQSGRIRWIHDGYDSSENLTQELAGRIETLLQTSR